MQGSYKGSNIRSLNRISPSDISPSDFVRNYILQRKPCIFTSHLTDPQWHASTRWSDLSYLAAKAGGQEAKVERLHPETKAFGSSLPRVQMTFGEFLKEMSSEATDTDGWEEIYLTTQYDESDSPRPTDGDQDDKNDNCEPPFTCPAPCKSLKDDFPLRPSLISSLVPHQVNLWLGRSRTQGRSSGLHHDHHDNLYILLSGHKRFVLFPPSAYPYLHFHGSDHREQAWENGVIAYSGTGMGADGLGDRERWSWEITRLEGIVKKLQKEEKAKTKGKDKGKGKGKKKGSKELEAAEGALAEAEDRLLEAIGEQDDFGEEMDDFDALSDLLGGGEDGDEESAKGGPDEDSRSIASASTRASGKGKGKGQYTGLEPPSFSRIPSSVLHGQLGLTSGPVPKVPDADLDVDVRSLNPVIVNLEPGEMLYLPASWIHEVTSTSVSSSSTDPSSQSSDVHMAFNYWFYPPDQLSPNSEGQQGVYKMQPLFDYLGEEVERIWLDTDRNDWKRKMEEGGASPRESKKKRRMK